MPITKRKLEQIKSKHIETVEKKRRKWKREHNTPFYKLQTRLVLRNIDIIDPLSIEEYIATDGYFALQKALSLKPDEIIQIISDSGLRGRGGAGFPTGKKWSFVKGASRGDAYVICNADEGDPGAFMDRAVLEKDPHSIIEAMAIAGYTVGATHGYAYIRAEYPKAVEHMKVAIKSAKKMGLLGKNIFGKGFNFDIQIRLGAGAYVCGEETALIASIEGKRGEPNPRPPFPATKGLWGKPTLINNVETLSVIPMIVLKGSRYFSKYGTSTSKGTKVFALAGNVQNAGLVEVPMGTVLRKVLFEIGGGPKCMEDCDTCAVKAVQTGGPSGGCVPRSMFDLSLDYESLQEIGSILGSGGLIVASGDACMVDMAKYFVEFSVDESCGKCVPCRVGNIKMLNILEKITKGHGEIKDLDELERLGKSIMDTSLCGLGQSSPKPVLSTLKHFRSEYLEHIENKRCPAGVCKKLSGDIVATMPCKNLVQYTINERCIMCSVCARACPVGAITGSPGRAHSLDNGICIKCDTCIDICPVKAIGAK